MSGDGASPGQSGANRPCCPDTGLQIPQPRCQWPQIADFGQRGTQRPTSVQGPGLYRALSCVGARAFVPCSVVHSTEVGVRIPYGPLVGGRLKWGESPSRKLHPGALKPVCNGDPLRAWSPKLPRIRCQMVFRYGELATPEPPLPHATGRPAAACSAGGTILYIGTPCRTGWC